jgi:hypothetical protein
MSKRKSRWKTPVLCVVLLSALYLASAAPTLSLWMKYENELNYANGNAWNMTPPQWWCMVYAPVLWIADQSKFGRIAIKPFEWLDMDHYVWTELWSRERE